MAMRELPYLAEYRGSHSDWHKLLPREWPQPHAHDHARAAGMRLFVYGLHGTPFSLSSLLEFAVRIYASKWRLYGHQDDCLVRYCDLGVATPHSSRSTAGRPQVNARQFTSEIPILLRILQSCQLVDDPAKADGFLVPTLLGTLATIRWSGLLGSRKVPSGANLSVASLSAELNRSLVYLNASTASRHIFLQSVDSLFLGARGPESEGGHLRALPTLTPNSSGISPLTLNCPAALLHCPAVSKLSE